MELRVKGGGSLSGEVPLQPSKLYTQFLSVLAFLGEGKSVVRRPLAVRDTLPLLRELEKLGATLNRGSREWTIWGRGGRVEPKGNVLEAGNSGTVFGMLAGLAALSSGVVVVTGDAQLRRRSMLPLLRMLRSLGGELSPTGSGGTPPFIVFGRGLRGGRVEAEPPELFPLLLLSPFTREGVEVEGEGEGRRMVEMMRRAGARISGRGRRIRISPGELRPGVLTVPPSFHAAAPFVLASLLTDSRLVFRGEGEGEGVSFLRLLEEMGVRVVRGGGGWRVRGEPRGAKLDLSGRAELFPYAAVLASAAEGRTVFRGLSRAREMKSDRLSLTVENLRKMGAKVGREGEGVVVEGGRKLRGARVKGGNDYAVVAAFLAAGLAAEGETVVVDGPRALRTSYSGFLSQWRKLGAEVEVGGAWG